MYTKLIFNALREYASEWKSNPKEQFIDLGSGIIQDITDKYDSTSFSIGRITGYMEMAFAGFGLGAGIKYVANKLIKEAAEEAGEKVMKEAGKEAIKFNK